MAKNLALKFGIEKLKIQQKKIVKVVHVTFLLGVPVKKYRVNLVYSLQTFFCFWSDIVFLFQQKVDIFQSSLSTFILHHYELVKNTYLDLSYQSIKQSFKNSPPVHQMFSTSIIVKHFLLSGPGLTYPPASEASRGVY